MIKSGAMDDFGQSRRALMHQVPEALKSADQQARAAAAGQNDMFGLESPTEPEDAAVSMDMDEWPERLLLSNEKEALGLYLTGHPFHAVRSDARCFVDGSLADLAAEPPPQTARGERDYAQSRREVTIAGLVVDVRKRGNRVRAAEWRSACSAKRSRSFGTCW
jgi:DNA polymerase-3 subunit alpha